MTIEIKKGGKIASKSENLRGILTYARKQPVLIWSAAMTEKYGAAVTVTFYDGASSSFDFLSWDVAQRWIRARKSWGLNAASIRPTSEVWQAA